ncbi:MAG: hypothetical protein ACD_30C00092G0018 [uncultured bacterium]|uniref:Uncharacterized protein n=2 Tax=Candidatus Daviesiibacteriota TaxID=1752718 RepID=A0A0G0HD36_9BACT|nr:MAG: hypothetical protein ACD_30C00092G0018 [uncultured bacterium]KKQ10034.1 MAG: hypothetical protein US19_C0009G0036 [Candidatus Daviesbacteria bacterium GW2011_GWB1_36_5]KKQ15921.1 MAG: hypothetical protein US28_C0007G0012 [Candidatus Daviesbacteria bacterium GW2011_GWA1_36_8]
MTVIKSKLLSHKAKRNLVFKTGEEILVEKKNGWLKNLEKKRC